MSSNHSRPSLFYLIALLAVLAVACASEAVELGSTDSPSIAGACHQDEPDCDDTPGGAPADLPEDGEQPDSGEPDTGVGALVNGGLSVAEALDTDAKGILAVRGHVYDDGTGVRLCEALATTGEGFACDGASVALDDLDLETVDELVFFEGTTYTDYEVTVFGEFENGTLRVDNAGY